MKETILGVDVTTKNYEQLEKCVVEDIEKKKQSFIVAINPEKVMTARKDETLKNMLNHTTYQIPDGMGIVLASKLKKGNIKSRVTGIDMMMKNCEIAFKYNKSIFLYGAKPGVALTAKEELEKQYPGIKIVGVIDGYEKDQNKILSDINSAKPDFLFVALGSPKQEYWIVENMKKLNVSIFQGVGGSFDVLSGNIKRAPKFFQKTGLEWFYRLLKEPKRIKRNGKLIHFLLLILFKRN